MVEKVVKLDFNTNIRARGQFARMAESCPKADGFMSRSKAAGARQWIGLREFGESAVMVATSSSINVTVNSGLLDQAVEAQVQMDQTEPAYELESLLIFLSNESGTMVETSMSAEIQCATTSHFNPTFKGPVEIGVSMSEGRGASEKNGIGRSGSKLSKSLRGHESIFKMTKSSLFPLSDSMNFMIELNTFQLKLESSKGDPYETEK
ncbi:hypothetical protein GOBAR_DD06569 [Gossypium barbadense]|nr:hypothetical protein GOBAR_DD06569 [Gossypium barbadense]